MAMGSTPRWYVFHWPNNTPAERAKLTEVEIKGPSSDPVMYWFAASRVFGRWSLAGSQNPKWHH
jgi:hypothetical protein